MHCEPRMSRGKPAPISISAADEIIPGSLKGITLNLSIAGRTFERELSPNPNRIMDFDWNGRDFTGNPIEAPTFAHMTVGYRYDAVYASPGDFQNSFGQTGGTPTPNPTRQQITLSNSKTVIINKAPGDIADGWNLSEKERKRLSRRAA